MLSEEKEKHHPNYKYFGKQIWHACDLPWYNSGKKCGSN